MQDKYKLTTAHPNFCISNKLRGDVDAAGPWTIFRAARKQKSVKVPGG